MSIENFNARIAPRYENKERIDEKLDSVVVIPVKEEGLNILPTLAHLATQEYDDRTHTTGVVLVINNRPDASPETKQSNFETYTLLQALRHKTGIVLESRPDLQDHIDVIKNSDLRIEVIDSFSDGHAEENSNVGTAREIGTQYALGLTRSDDSAILSKDGDTIYGPRVLMEVRQVFEETDLDAFPLNLKADPEMLEDHESRQALNRFRLHQDINFVVRYLHEQGVDFIREDDEATQPYLDHNFTVIGGAYGAFRAGALRKTDGYDRTGTAEDITMAGKITDQGGLVGEPPERFEGLTAFTRPRVSERTTLGYGHGFAKWNKEGQDLGDVEVLVPETLERNSALFSVLETMHSEPLDKVVMALVLSDHYEGSDFEPYIKMAKLKHAHDGVKNSSSHIDYVTGVNEILKDTAETMTFSELLDEAGTMLRNRFGAFENWTDRELEYPFPFPKCDWTFFKSELTRDIMSLDILHTRDSHETLRAMTTAVYHSFLKDVISVYQMNFAHEKYYNEEPTPETARFRETLASQEEFFKDYTYEYTESIINRLRLKAFKVVALGLTSATPKPNLEKEAKEKIHQYIKDKYASYGVSPNDPIGVEAEIEVSQ